MASIIAHSDTCPCDICNPPTLLSKLAYIEGHLCTALRIRKNIDWFVQFRDEKTKDSGETTVDHWNEKVVEGI